ADGYARSTGKVGAYIVVPGPGVLNTAGALSTAYACNSPVLCITGQIQSDLIDIGRGMLHEVDDQLGMLRHVTKWNARAMTPNGRGALSDRHPLAIIQLGLSELLAPSDAVLVVGSRGLDFTNSPLKVSAGASLIRIDADGGQLNRTIVPTVAIAGDAKLVLAELANRIGAHNRQRDSRPDQVASIKEVV